MIMYSLEELKIYFSITSGVSNVKIIVYLFFSDFYPF